MGSFAAFPQPAQITAEMFRVVRPGVRVVLNIGERVTPGTQTHRMLGQMWVWAEDDARRMVEDAGFTDVTIQYARRRGTLSGPRHPPLLTRVDRHRGVSGRGARYPRRTTIPGA
jgi:hypothetical protein